MTIPTNAATSTGRALTSRDLLRFRMADDPQISPDGRQVAWVQTWMVGETDSYQSRIFVTDVATGDTRQLTEGAGLHTHPRWSKDGKWIAFLSTGAVSEADEPAGDDTESRTSGDVEPVRPPGGGSQLYVVAAEGGRARQLTNLAGGAHDPSWSPRGDRLLFTTFVHPERGLESKNGAQADDDDFYTHFNRDVLTVTQLRWKSDSLGLIGDYRRHAAIVEFSPDNTGGQPEPVLLSLGEYDVASPRWSPDGRSIAVAGNIRPEGDATRESFIYLFDLKADMPADPRELFGLAEMRSTDLAWSPDGSTIAVCGHNDPELGHYGNQRLWLVSVTDGAGRCVTDHVDRTLGDYSRNYDMRRYGADDGPRWLPDGNGLLVLVNEGGTVHLHELALADGSLTQLTQGDLVVKGFTMDTNASRLAVLIGEDVNPGDIFVMERDAETRQKPKQLTDVNGELFSEISLSPSTRFSFNSEGVEIDAWLVPPLNREPGEKYPVILYTGGGPGGMRASVFVFEFQLYAAQGYAVLHCNARGNQGYGEEFSRVIRGKWGDEDYRDNMNCLHAAVERFDFLDGQRMAVAGGSYGGYSATWIIARHPEFKAAVVDRCLFNRYSFNGTGDISFLLDQIEFDKQLPWEATDRYLYRSPMQHVAGIRTPTLVVHSALDYRCPIDQGEQLYMALKRLDVPTELVRFPNENHDLSRSGRPWHRVFRMDRYLEWFERWV